MKHIHQIVGPVAVVFILEDIVAVPQVKDEIGTQSEPVVAKEITQGDHHKSRSAIIGIHLPGGIGDIRSESEPVTPGLVATIFSDILRGTELLGIISQPECGILHDRFTKDIVPEIDWSRFNFSGITLFFRHTLLVSKALLLCNSLFILL